MTAIVTDEVPHPGFAVLVPNPEVPLMQRGAL